MKILRHLIIVSMLTGGVVGQELGDTLSKFIAIKTGANFSSYVHSDAYIRNVLSSVFFGVVWGIVIGLSYYAILNWIQKRITKQQ
ncbi:hypothetical protein ACO0LC_28785 [Undibacterium sp. JH2W]|uniref:hypothetical protein n=1 Tax=Undibacterium sp. JH2W TaxID=3413037 RepID=UPI003BEFD190